MTRGSLLLCCAALAAAPAATGQVLLPWGEPTNRSVSLDMLRPEFDGGGTSTLTTINQLGARWRVGSVVLIGQLPFVNAKVDGASSGALMIGNPLFGVGTSSTGRFFGEIGVRIPLASASTLERQFAELVGLIGDYQDLDAYLEDLLTIRGTVGYRHRAANHFGMRAALRPTLISPVGSNSGDSELFLDYGIQGGYETDRASAGLTFSGRALITESGSIGERTVHDVALGGSMTFGRFRPGLLIRVPIENDLGDALSYSLGITLQLTF